MDGHCGDRDGLYKEVTFNSPFIASQSLNFRVSVLSRWHHSHFRGKCDSRPGISKLLERATEWMFLVLQPTQSPLVLTAQKLPQQHVWEWKGLGSQGT